MSKSTRHQIDCRSTKSAVEVNLCRLVNEVRIPWDRDQTYCETYIFTCIWIHLHTRVHTRYTCTHTCAHSAHL